MILGIDPKVDYAFKRLFGREQNRALLADVIDAVLRPLPEHRIVELQILNPFNDKQAPDDKLSVVDVKARDQSGRQFNVEMQMVAERHLARRILYYWARLHQQQMREGDDYSELRPTVSICFLNSTLFPSVPNYHLPFQLLNAEHKLAFSSDLDLHIIELAKFNRSADELADSFDAWVFFLKNAEWLDNDALPESLNRPAIHQAVKELVMLTQDDLERERYEARLKLQRDERSRFQSALTDGERIGVIRLCQRRLNLAVTPVDELANLHFSELDALAERLENQLFDKS